MLYVISVWPAAYFARYLTRCLLLFLERFEMRNSEIHQSYNSVTFPGFCPLFLNVSGVAFYNGVAYVHYAVIEINVLPTQTANLGTAQTVHHRQKNGRVYWLSCILSGCEKSFCFTGS